MINPPEHAKQTPTEAQFALAFDEALAPAVTSPLYRAAVIAVFCVMVLLPAVYLGIIALSAAGVYWYATNATAMFSSVSRSPRLLLVALVLYIAPLFAGAMLVIFMVLPLFWRSKKSPKPYWVDRREQPLLYAYIDKLCDAMNAPRPARIDVVPEANAMAHIDNGVFGLFSRRLVLTVVTIRYYTHLMGDALQPEHLYSTAYILAKKAAVRKPA